MDVMRRGEIHLAIVVVGMITTGVSITGAVMIRPDYVCEHDREIESFMISELIKDNLEYYNSVRNPINIAMSSVPRMVDPIPDLVHYDSQGVKIKFSVTYHEESNRTILSSVGAGLDQEWDNDDDVEYSLSFYGDILTKDWTNQRSEY